MMIPEDAVVAMLRSYQVLFAKGVGIESPWQVTDVELKNKELDVRVALAETVVELPCPLCHKASPIYDRSDERRWRTLDYFMYKAYIVTRSARVNCTEHGIHRVEVPWARAHSHFTHHFEALILALATDSPVATVAEHLREHDTRLWRVVIYHVFDALRHLDLSGVRRIGVDDKSYRVGHRYVTVVADLDGGRVIYATEGRDASTLLRFRDHLVAHGGTPEMITEVSQDMSQAYAKGVRAAFPGARITYDHFHVIKLVGEAVDEVRRNEQRYQDALRGTRYIWLKNAIHLSKTQHSQLTDLSRLNLKTVRAYKARLDLQDIYMEFDADVASQRLHRWYYRATHSKLDPIIRVAHTIMEHLGGILNYFTSRATNALLEGINSLIQATKAKARGYRSVRNLLAMIYLIGGNIRFRLPILYRD